MWDLDIFKGDYLNWELGMWGIFIINKTGHNTVMVTRVNEAVKTNPDIK